MPVPNNYSFSVLNVKNEIEAHSSNNAGDLTSCFFLAAFERSGNGFNPSYEGDKMSLRNFRDYDHSLPSTTSSVSLGFGSSANAACQAQGSGNNVTRYLPVGQGLSTATNLYSNSTGTTNAPTGYYSQSGIWRYWTGNSFSSGAQSCNF